jgi:hypothetical protein
MRELDLTNFLKHTGKNVHSFSVELGLSPPKVHYWKHNCKCMVQFDEDNKVHKIRLLKEKVVYKPCFTRDK